MDRAVHLTHVFIGLVSAASGGLLLPGQRGSREQRPEVRRRRPLLRAQVEAQVCGAERHGLRGVTTRQRQAAV